MSCSTRRVLLGVGSHVGHGKVNSNCYHNSNCFDNSETTATSMHGYDVITCDVCVTHGKDLSVMQHFLHKSTLISVVNKVFHGNGSIM